MKLYKAFKALLLITILSTTGVVAQQQMMPPQVAPADSVSEVELAQFVDIAMDLQNIRMEMDSLVIDRLDIEGMTPQRFQQIMMEKQQPNAAQNSTVTPEEEKILTSMQTFLQEVSMKAQQKQMTAIQESEMSQQRFQSIAQALQTDKELATRFQQMAMEAEAN